MRRREERSERLWSPVLIGVIMIMLLSVLPVAQMGKVKAANGLEKQQQNHYTSTESVLEQSYEELIASLDQDALGGYLSTLKVDASYIIPGISNTNIQNERSCGVMTPQGVCVAGDYLIISAYDKSTDVTNDFQYMSDAKNKSVLYIMDAKSGRYLTTISLDTECHVGALAYNPDDDIIYIADSDDNAVQKLSLDRIEARVAGGQDAESEIMEFDDGAIDTQGYNPSFLAYYQNHLYVGQFAKKNRKEKASNQLVLFENDGTLLAGKTISVPYYAQGVTFAEWKGDTYMLVSSSYGRTFTSKLHVYLMDTEKDGVLQCDWKVGELSCPNMSEDIDIVGDSIYTCYESAANFYRLALDGKGQSTNVVDRIMVSSLEMTLMTLMSGAEQICALPVALSDRLKSNLFIKSIIHKLPLNKQDECDYFKELCIYVVKRIT